MNADTSRWYAQAREMAISLLKEGKSDAEVWEALVAHGVDGTAAEAIVRELNQLRQQAAAPAASVYTPPVAMNISPAWVEEDRGSFAKGFIAGLLCGCWALMVVVFLSHRTMGSETKRGIYVGFAINMCIGILYALMKGTARGY